MANELYSGGASWGENSFVPNNFAGYSGTVTAGAGYTLSGMAGLGVATSVLSGIRGYQASKIQASGYKIQEIQANTQAYIANLNAQTAGKINKARAGIVRLQGKADSLALSRAFNQTQASNVVMAAAQNRRFEGSVAAVSDAAESQYNWDLDFTELSAEIQALGVEASGSAEKFNYEMQVSGAKSQAQQYGFAAKASTAGGLLGSLGGQALGIGTSLYSIGG